MSIILETVTLLFIEWCKEHRIANTAANGSLVATYLRENNLVVSWKNFNAAFEALKGKLEVIKTPEEIEAERIEQIRQAIYADVVQKIAPAKLNFKDPATINPLSSWLHKNKAGRMSADTLMEAIHALRFELPWVVEPKGLARDRRNTALGYDDSRTEHGIQGRRNHAEDVFDKESAKRTAANKKALADQESKAIGELWAHEIDSYRAVVNGRISYSKTETIQNLLRKWKGNPIEAIRSMPDDPDQAEIWLRKRL